MTALYVKDCQDKATWLSRNVCPSQAAACFCAHAKHMLRVCMTANLTLGSSTCMHYVSTHHLALIYGTCLTDFCGIVSLGILQEMLQRRGQDGVS